MFRAEGDFCEILPPRAGDFSNMLAKVRRCHEAGVDAINIPDGPRASARVSPMITALVILREVGIEPVSITAAGTGT
jgi:homocysteine S-methyltransferase